MKRVRRRIEIERDQTIRLCVCNFCVEIRNQIERENEEGPKQKCNDLIKPLRVIFELSRISSFTKVNKQLILKICFRKNADSQLST